MARISIAISVSGTSPATSDAGLFGSVGHIPDVAQTVASTTVATDVGVLVADAGSPTQAHVTTLNTDWTALLAGLPGVPSPSDVILSYNAATVVSKNVLRRAVAHLLRVVESSGDLT